MPPLRPQECQNADFGFTTWLVNVAADTAPEDTLAPEYYALVSRSMAAGDVIRLLWDDMSKERCLTVIQKSGNHVRVAAHGPVIDLQAADGSSEVIGDGAFEIVHKGFGKWSVIDKSAVNPTVGEVAKNLTKAEAEAKLAKLTGAE